MKIISWNLDGLDGEGLFERTIEVVPILNNYDVIFLQEVVRDIKDILEPNLENFHQFVGGLTDSYFVMVLLKKSKFQTTEASYAPFLNSQMARGLLAVRAMSGGESFNFATSHLESMAQYSKDRVQQLELILDFFSDNNEKIIFGGDFNLRDKEIKEMSEKHQNIYFSKYYDCWERAGSDPNKKFTWDLAKNTNKIMPGNGKPRCRFDRIFCSKNINIEKFDLEGTQKTGKKFISDHFGISLSIQ